MTELAEPAAVTHDAGDESAFANPDTSAFDAGSSSEDDGEEEAGEAAPLASQQQQQRQAPAGAARGTVGQQLKSDAAQQPARCVQAVCHT